MDTTIAVNAALAIFLAGMITGNIMCALIIKWTSPTAHWLSR